MMWVVAWMNREYDVNIIYSEMEQRLIEGYKKSMEKNMAQKPDANWQRQKLADLQAYKKEARRVIDKHTRQAKDSATGHILDSYDIGVDTADAIIRIRRKVDRFESFGKTNRRKVDALLDAVDNDFSKASEAALRLVDDQYRKIVFKSQVMYSSGVTTLPQAIDMAAKDFLQAGINCIVFSNGNRVNIASYAEMALRASGKAAYLTGEGARQAEWGEYLTQITSYGGCSPKCLPWQGRVYVNDVYAGGKADGKYPLLSTAMANGLFHPNCRHTAQPYFEGISTLPPKVDEGRNNEVYEAEQNQRYIERKIREWKRVQEGSVDPANQAKAQQKVQAWQAEMRQHLKDNPFLFRKSYREQILPRKG
jgi:hypothetical protein